MMRLPNPLVAWRRRGDWFRFSSLRRRRYRPGIEIYDGLHRDIPCPGVAGRYFKALDGRGRWYLDDGRHWLHVKKLGSTIPIMSSCPDCARAVLAQGKKE